MLLDLLPSEQASPQRPAAVVGGSLLLDLLSPALSPAPTALPVAGGGAPLQFVCARCRCLLDLGQDCPDCLRQVLDLDDELALMALGVL